MPGRSFIAVAAVLLFGMTEDEDLGVPTGAIVSDPAASQRRKDDLSRYQETNVYNPRDGFLCASGTACKASAHKRPGSGFYEAQGSSVGAHYELADDGRPLRVLVVPMVTGRARAHVSVDERTGEVMNVMERPFRQRNPHMRGVTLALRLAFGHSLDEDEEGEWITAVDGQRFHVLDAYAMANLLLGSAVQLDTPNSRSTSVMRSNCSRHMGETVRLLAPTLVVSQGVNLSKPLRSLFEVVTEHSPNLAECRLGDRDFVWADLRHPTRHWDWLSRAYLQEVVGPTLRQARRLALA